MSNYTRAIDLTAKDALTTGDPNKVIKGSEIDAELDLIASASATKADKVLSATTNNIAKLDSAGNLVDSGYRFENISGGVSLYVGGDSSLGFPTGTKMLFQQTTAPTGWTKITAGVDNKALRIVSGPVVGGGTDSFTSVFNAAKATESYKLLAADIPTHTHSGVTSVSGSHVHTYPVSTGSAGAIDSLMNNQSTSGTEASSAAGSHSHSFNTDGGTGGNGGHAHDITMDLQYVDVIIASKD